MIFLEEAIKLFGENKATCVIVSENITHISHERGVKPLLSLVENKSDVRGGSAADKVVGKAAAMLYILLGIKELYACVISKLAVEILEKHGIAVRYDTLVPMIRNRDDTGFCPMEQAVKNINSSREGLVAIKDKLKELERLEK